MSALFFSCVSKRPTGVFVVFMIRCQFWEDDNAQDGWVDPGCGHSVDGGGDRFGMHICAAAVLAIIF